jgi:hypothetical protein
MVLTNGSRNQIRRTVDEIMGDLYSAEDDLNWHEAIFDGTWPNAVEILEDKLEKARKHKETRGY